MPAKTYLLLLLALSLPGLGNAGPLRDLLKERVTLPSGSEVRRDLPYGAHPRQRYDLYLPAAPRNAPIIFMVHGGGWHTGDKAMAAVVDNKVAHWLARGYTLVSSNYRLLPEANPLEQVRDVASAFAEVQRQAPGWGGDPARMVLMGHSAGAHLVSLLASDPALARGIDTPWLGTVALDSAAFDVPRIMNQRHFALYDDAFGKDQALWQAASPLLRLQRGARPFLAVCSTRRAEACAQADAFASKAAGLGVQVSVLRQDLSHRQINQMLGEAPDYTAAVDAFLARQGLP
ncbi:alpha/beta hydrolase [Pseudomonas sp. BMS12]|uniref:alpha/beta hydrolase n=1 Tax=Pseudomonas sp. BMS12 TaxID=1796033 RepID=UPI00083B986F|nr:alpha/beta hydrolase [Pseudomonas sp. BMS12]